MSEQNLIEIVTYSETRHWSEDGHQAQCNQTIWGDPVHEYVGRASRALDIPQGDLLADHGGHGEQYAPGPCPCAALPAFRWGGGRCHAHHRRG